MLLQVLSTGKSKPADSLMKEDLGSVVSRLACLEVVGEQENDKLGPNLCLAGSPQKSSGV